MRSRISVSDRSASENGLRTSGVAALGQPRPRLLDNRNAGHDLARGAEAALEAVVLDEGRLQRMERAVVLQPLDGGDALAALHRGERHAGEDAAPIHVHRAGAALAAIAALLRPGQHQLLAQGIEQRRARLDRNGERLAVDLQSHGHALQGLAHGVVLLATSAALMPSNASP
jgi:hypothetical protein